jgi:UDP-2,4-diacetamido-2,4,6-trideoxy-beta-L-altropyranose hydrolase
MKLLARADADPSIGAGHVMRCLALLLAVRANNGAAHFVGHIAIPWIQERLRRENIEVTFLSGDIPNCENSDAILARMEKDADWVVLDGYHFGAECHRAIRNAGHKLLVIDDHAHLSEYECDVLLNQNIGADRLTYRGAIGKKLMGPRFALLRPEFIAARKRAEKRIFSGKAQKLLLSLGGGDSFRHLEKLAPYFMIPELDGCILRVIASIMPGEKIRYCLRNCNAVIEIITHIDDMPELLLDTDLCITAGGSTYLELCYLKVPFLTTAIADNQCLIVQELARIGIPIFCSESIFRNLLTDGNMRQMLAGTANNIVSHAKNDSCFFAMFKDDVTFRQAALEDCDAIFAIINDPDRLANAISPHKVTFEEHKSWYLNRMRYDDNSYLLAFFGNKLIGFIRFDKDHENEFIVSILIVKEWRGIGLGRELISKGCHMFSPNNEKKMVAYIKKGNEASFKAFCSSGFKLDVKNESDDCMSRLVRVAKA